jgi:hypothetical protein
LSGVVQIRERREEFDDFALTILTNIASVFPNNLKSQSLPSRIRRELAWPRLGAGFRLQGAAFEGICICAESPTIAALLSAGGERWAVLRYTDTESIKEIVNPESQLSLPYLPRQIRLPDLSRRSENRGLATRGIDPRDVVRLANDEWKRWKSRLPRPLRTQVRTYRTFLSELEQNGRVASESLEFILPRRDVQQAGGEANALLRYVDRRDRRVRNYQSAGKRLSDLRVAWSRPVERASRFILADGIVPCQFAELELNEVPAQRFFIIDGDAAVPALLGSRIFAAWAKITLTRSTSWMPRFSVSRTFETFPVPPPFLLARMEDGSTQLRMKGNKRVRSLAERLREMYRERDIGSVRELHEEVDRAILRGMNLDENSSDLAIIELFLQSNFRFYA